MDEGALALNDITLTKGYNPVSICALSHVGAHTCHSRALLGYECYMMMSTHTDTCTPHMCYAWCGCGVGWLHYCGVVCVQCMMNDDDAGGLLFG